MGTQNEALINRFYTAFQKKDATTMVACYHDDVEFQDPAFGKLKGESAKNMWKMLLARSTDLEITFSDVRADESTGSAYWEAKYLFSKTKRQVHNKIRAQFQFKDGKIFRHDDHFSMWKWASMALGPVGFLLGATPIIKSKIQKQTNSLLKEFMEKNS